MVVNHKDCNKLNNSVDNLEWVTQKQNANCHGKQTCHERKVMLRDFDGNITRVFNSVTEAAKMLGVSRSAVSKVCLGINKTVCGHLLEYESNSHVHELYREGGLEIQGYTNYLVYDNGDIYSIKRKKFLKHVVNASGYCYVSLCNSNGKQNHYVHVIVAKHFLPQEGGKNVVNHKDLNKTNNYASNLEWVTSSENRIHAHINKPMVPRVTRKSHLGCANSTSDGNNPWDRVNPQPSS
jgi:hypothetical protein